MSLVSLAFGKPCPGPQFYILLEPDLLPPPPPPPPERERQDKLTAFDVSQFSIQIWLTVIVQFGIYVASMKVPFNIY